MGAAPRWPSPEPLEEGGDRVADLGRRVLLDEVAAAHGDLLLIGPGAAELALRTGQDHTWLGVDEQLGDGARGEPLRIALDDRDDVGRLAVDRDLARPRERGPA